MMALAAALFAAVLATPAGGAEVTAAPFLNVPLSVQQAGGGGVSLLARDATRSYSNPALMGEMDGKAEAALLTGNMFSNQTLFGLGGGYRLNPDWTVGGFVHMAMISFEAVDGMGDSAPGPLEQNTRAIGATGAYKWRWLNAGLTMKMIGETVGDDGWNSFVSDLGVVASQWGASLGIAVCNLGPDLVADDKDTEVVESARSPTDIRIALSYLYQQWNLKGGLEIDKETARDMTLGLGFDWWYRKMLGLRFGFRPAMADDTNMKLSVGLSGLYRSIGLDYAFLTHAAGITNRIALSYAWGAPGETARAAERAREEKVREPEPVKEEPVKEPEPAPVAKPSSGTLNLAIADLSAQGVSASDAAVMADLLRSEMVKTGKFNVIEKQNMDKVLAEHAFQQTGCTSEECAVKLGKLLNVQRMVVGSFGKLLDSYFLNVRVVDVETGKVTYGDSVEGSRVGDLKTGVRDLANKMAKQIR